MGQLCSCARSQDTRGRKWVNNTILTRSPSTTSSNYGPNIIIKHTPDGALQRSLYSPGGASHAPPSHPENRISRSHRDCPEDSGINGISSTADEQSTDSLKVIYSCHQGQGQAFPVSVSNGPVSRSVQPAWNARERSPTKPFPAALEKSSSVCDISPTRHDITPDLDLRISESAQAEIARSAGGSDVAVKVTPVNDHLETQAQKVRSVLQRTVELLTSEIDSSTLFEYLQRSRPGQEVTNADWARCCSPSGAQDIFWDIITQQQEDGYAIFCQIIDSKPHFRHLLDLLQTLDSVIALIAPDLDDDDDDEDDVTDGCHDDDSGSRAELDRFSGCDSCVESSDFDLDLMFCHRETTSMSTMSPVPRDERSPAATHFDYSNLSLAGSSCLPSITGDELGQPTVPMVSLTLVNYCLRRRRRATLLHRVLEGSSCIRELSLVKTHLDDDDLALLLRLLRTNASVVRLDLRLSRIDDAAADHLGQTVRHNSLLRLLNVAGTGLSDVGCSRLMSGLVRNRSLCDLDIGFNDVRDTGCCAVAEALARSNPLRKVRMRDNGITCYGACALFQSLARNCRLVFLDISSNGIGNDCLRHLSEALIANRTLRDLNLENCRISADGCVALARALRANTALRCLQLSLNPIADAGIGVLADGLRYNHAIETLSANMCNIGNLGFLRLLDTLRSNFTLKTVKLCYNNIGSGSSGRDGDVTSGVPFMDEVYVRLYEVLHYNPKLKVLLWGNDLERIQTTTESGSMENQFDQHHSSFHRLASYSPIMSAHRQDVLVSI